MSKEDEGKLVDSGCHRLTASFVRRSHQKDKNVPVCLYFEVGMRSKVIAVLNPWYVHVSLQEFDDRGRKESMPPGIYDLVCALCNIICNMFHCCAQRALLHHPSAHIKTPSVRYADVLKLTRVLVHTLLFTNAVVWWLVLTASHCLQS